jgi:hypothetical protein
MACSVVEGEAVVVIGSDGQARVFMPFLTTPCRQPDARIKHLDPKAENGLVALWLAIAVRSTAKLEI